MQIKHENNTMQPESYIETLPKELGIELLDIMTTEQVVKLLTNNPTLFYRYQDYFKDRLDAETKARKTRHKKWKATLKRLEKLRSNPEWKMNDAILLNTQITEFMNLPYRTDNGLGYYSMEALVLWIRLFIMDNRDPDGFVSLNPEEQDILGLPSKVEPQEFMNLFFPFGICGPAFDVTPEIMDYLVQEEEDLSDMSNLEQQKPSIADTRREVE